SRSSKPREVLMSSQCYAANADVCARRVRLTGDDQRLTGDDQRLTGTNERAIRPILRKTPSHAVTWKPTRRSESVGSGAVQPTRLVQECRSMPTNAKRCGGKQP